jgi:poly-gamma-glutamate system protein
MSKKKIVLLASGLLSLVFFGLARLLAEKPLRIRAEMVNASGRMEQALTAVRRCREACGLSIDIVRDVNRTGIIGLETSPITTSLGNLEAKRTTTNPNFAALITLLLTEAGVRKGDTVAVGASSSFPALIVASLCAAQALELRPLLICSLGASQWGANHPGLHWLDILECLRRSGVLEVEPIALSLGGEGDSGKDMSPEGRALLLRAAAESRLPFLSEPELAKNVRARLRFYETAGQGRPIKAFINIGGGYANMGTDSEILKVSPGLAVFSKFPPADRRGVIFEMAARRVPVIHLLYIKGLCDRYGLPWDPSPLPRPGEGSIYDRTETSPRVLSLIAGAYFVLLAVGVVIFLRA